MAGPNYLLLVLCFYTLTITCSSKKIVCGNPPDCFYYTTIMLVECRNIRVFPLLENDVSLRTRTVLITGEEFDHWPVALYNRSLFPALVTVKLENTKFPCKDISKDKLFYNVLGCISDGNSKLSNVSLGSPRPAPKLKTIRPSIKQTTTTNETIEWTTMQAFGPNLKKKTVAPVPLQPNFRTINQESVFWMNPTTYSSNGTAIISDRDEHQGFVREEWLTQARIFAACGSTVMLAVIVILLLIVFRYRRQHGRLMSKVPEGHRLPSVENLGALSLDSASGDSIELFSHDMSRPTSLRRRSMEKEL